MLTSRKLVMLGSTAAALLLAACSDSAVAPGGNDVVGSAAFARNGSVSPNPDKNQSCEQDGGTRKSQSKEKNSCVSGPPSFKLVDPPLIEGKVFYWAAGPGPDCTYGEFESVFFTIIEYVNTNDFIPVCSTYSGSGLDANLLFGSLDQFGYEPILDKPGSCDVTQGGVVCKISQPETTITFRLISG